MRTPLLVYVPATEPGETQARRDARHMTLPRRVASYRLEDPDEDVEDDDDDDDDQPADSNLGDDEDDEWDEDDDEDDEEEEETWQVRRGNHVPLKAGAGLTSPTKSA